MSDGSCGQEVTKGYTLAFTTLFAALGGLALGCGSGGRTEPKLTYRPYRSTVLEYRNHPEGSADDVLVLVLSEDARWPFAHDTIAEVTGTVDGNLSRFRTFGPAQRRGPFDDRRVEVQSVQGCRNIRIVPADSINPQRMYCLRREPTRPRTVVTEAPPDYSPLKELAWRLGGHAVLLDEVRGDLVRAWVIKCPAGERVASCL